MKNLIRVVIISGIICTSLMQSSSDFYPFKKNPGLSWSEFEKNLRKTYPHLDIPRIVTCDSDEFLAMFVYKKDDVDLPKINQLMGVEQQVPFIIVNPSSSMFRSPEQLEGVILHEAGHYSRQAELEQSLARAKTVSQGVFGSIIAANVGLAIANIARCRSCAGVRRDYLLLQAILASYLVQKDAVKQLVDDVIGVRSEEYAADQFVHRHARKEALVAYRDYYTKKTATEMFIESVFDTPDQEISKNYLMFRNQNKDESVTIANTSKEYINRLEWVLLFCKFIGCMEHYASVLDLSHPSDPIRYKLADQALQERFGQ